MSKKNLNTEKTRKAIRLSSQNSSLKDIALYGKNFQNTSQERLSYSSSLKNYIQDADIQSQMRISVEIETLPMRKTMEKQQQTDPNFEMKQKLDQELKKWGWNEDYAKELEKQKKHQNFAVQNDFIRMQSVLDRYESLSGGYQKRAFAQTSLGQHLEPLVTKAQTFKYREKFKSPLVDPLLFDSEVNAPFSVANSSMKNQTRGTIFKKRSQPLKLQAKSIDMKRYEPKPQKILLASILNKTDKIQMKKEDQDEKQEILSVSVDRRKPIINYSPQSVISQNQKNSQKQKPAPSLFTRINPSQIDSLDSMQVKGFTKPKILVKTILKISQPNLGPWSAKKPNFVDQEVDSFEDSEQESQKMINFPMIISQISQQSQFGSTQTHIKTKSEGLNDSYFFQKLAKNTEPIPAKERNESLVSLKLEIKKKDSTTQIMEMASQTLIGSCDDNSWTDDCIVSVEQLKENKAILPIQMVDQTKTQKEPLKTDLNSIKKFKMQLANPLVHFEHTDYDQEGKVIIFKDGDIQQRPQQQYQKPQQSKFVYRQIKRNLILKL